MVGNARDPIPASKVKIYLHEPSQYEEVAIIEASSKGGGFGDQAKMEKAVERLKEEAASLGANGILFKDSESESGGAIYTAPNQNTGVGFAATSHHKLVKGIAIYVPESAQSESNNTVVAPDSNAAQKLRDLQKLKDDGLITEDEYQQKRKKLLESF
jgi:Short C-terminal domain